MREILFRGQEVDNGEWVYGSYVNQYGCHEIMLDGVDCEYGFDRYHVSPETIGQYTGLKDKHGKRIFEGDIVRLIESCPSCHDTEIVKFEDGGFAPFSIAEWECTPKWEECEVIGNIHDNPELLEEEHE